MAQSLTLIEQLWGFADRDYAEFVDVGEMDPTKKAKLQGALSAYAETIALFMNPYMADRKAVTREIMRRHKEQDFTTVEVAQKIDDAAPKPAPAVPRNKAASVLAGNAEFVEAYGSGLFKDEQLVKLFSTTQAQVDAFKESLKG